ncbi:MAG: hypothetical protein IT182_09250 [Acidobacteria bacterium]|nr:hypothetical protein [Acidobacteriota bacterium]
MRRIRISRELRPGPVLFRVAAGPRIGHGHLRRAEALAAALGQPAALSLRGACRAPTTLPVVEGQSAIRTLRRLAPAVVVIDDPRAKASRVWADAALRHAVPVVSVHDLGLARIPSMLAVDGSVSSPARGWPSDAVLRGLPYAVIRQPMLTRHVGAVRRLLVSLGGGPRVALTRAIVREVARRHPEIEIVVTQPGIAGTPGASRVTSVVLPNGLAPTLAHADLAILGGGISLYEAIAAGVPTVAVAIVASQRPTIRGFAAAGLARDGAGRARTQKDVAHRVADGVDEAIRDLAWRRHVRRAGPQAIDGYGASRVARAIVRLVGETGRA